MKPLLKKEIEKFLDRFHYFIDGEFLDIKPLSSTSIQITLTAQDKVREFNWINITLEFNSIIDAKLLTNNQLGLLETQKVSIIHDDGYFAFAVGECYNIETVKSSALFVISKDIKYKEELF